MDGNDFNLITPVNSLQNISSTQYIERRKERKRKNKEKHKQQEKHIPNKDETKPVVDEPLLNRDDPHSIDFQA